jgi:hypothetical protein
VLTPAEELGLSGSSLANRVRKAFYTIPPATLVELIARIRDESFRRKLIYLRDGEVDTIRVLPCPVTVLPDQLSYVHYVTVTIINALKRLPDLYLQDLSVRELLKLSPEEEAWLLECWGLSQRELNPVFGRLDAMIDFTSPTWKNTLQFVEPNLSGVGGLHMIPTCEQILADVVLPVLQVEDPELQLETIKDIRELLMQEILDHLEALGRPAQNVCFVEPKYADAGPDEQEALAQYYHERYGTRVMHADPSELSLKGSEVYYEGQPVDLAYRDYEVRDLIALGQEGVDVAPLRALFRQNRIVSSITAEFDQKSAWEVFTDPQLASKYFSAEERQIFRRHILWTRVVSDRRTLLPGGHEGDLLEFARRERETLVLKPNRSYGGTGVLIGLSTEESEWDKALGESLANPQQRWVVQQLATIPVTVFPVVTPEGEVHTEPFNVVMGFAATRYGLSILGRASQKQVVNVAQRGGLCGVMVGHPPTRLLGPAHGA